MLLFFAQVKRLGFILGRIAFRVGGWYDISEDVFYGGAKTMEWSERRLSDIAENFGWVSSAETKACELHQALISTHRMVAPPAPFLCCLVTLPRVCV